MSFGRLCFWLSWPALYLYFASGTRTRVIITHQHKVLLVKGWWSVLFADAAWALPGGGLKRGEQPLAGAGRELAEELHLIVEPSQLQPLGLHLVSERGIHYTAYYFRLELEALPALKTAAEIRDMEWVDLDALPPAVQLKPEVEIARQLLGNS